VKKILAAAAAICILGTFSNRQAADITIRWGQGGFTDDRSPIGKLGGQLTLDIKPTEFPLAFSISGEYYTNSPAATHPYEIADLTSFNMLYMTKPFKNKNANVFMGGGAGWLKVPNGKIVQIEGRDEPEAMEKGIMYNLEAGINIRIFRKMGFYGICKHLYARKEKNNIKVIDFSERIVLLGFTFNFTLFNKSQG